MSELSDEEKLFQFWMIYTSKTDAQALKDYIHLFIESRKHLVDYDFKHLTEGFAEEGPHLNKLPDGILQVLGNQLNQCCYGDDLGNFRTATDILRCLIILCRNYDNVQLVASCEFSSYTFNISTVVVSKLKSTESEEEISVYTLFLMLALHLFECLYDPYFIWRKHLLGWSVDQSRQKFKPALLHVEVIPFFHECFQQQWMSTDLKVRLLHMFGAVISGSLSNALIAITPATLDVLLRILGSSYHGKPTNEGRAELMQLKSVVLKCVVRMIHVIHCCSPDQRQVEVSQIMEGYMQVLLDTQTDVDADIGVETQVQLNMIGAMSDMLSCGDKAALQVILVSGGTFGSLMDLLQKTPLYGSEAQDLAMSVLKVIRSVLAGSSNVKERFKLSIGYTRFLEVLKSLGQPSVELLKSVLDLVVEGQFVEKKSQSLCNTQAAIMLIQWLPDIQSHDLQTWLTEHLRLLCSAEYNNKMSCCKNGMISAIFTVLGRERQINSLAVGHLIGLLETLGTQSITAIELRQLIGQLRLDEDGNQNTYCSRLMRAMSTMARREGKEGALHFFNIQDPTDGILLPGIRKWPGTAFSFHCWIALNTTVDQTQHGVHGSQSYRRILYSFLSNSGSGFEAFVGQAGELTLAVFNKKEHSSVTVPELDLYDGQWHDVCIVHTNSKRLLATSQMNVYVDGKLKHNCQLKYPCMTEQFTSCRIGAHVWSSQPAVMDTATSPTKKPSPFKNLFTSAMKSSSAVPGIDTIPYGSQEDRYGTPISLNGQVGSVCIYHEAVNAAQVKKLYTAGPNNLTVYTEESELQDLPAKMVLHYNARACKDSKIMDLSSNENDGVLSGQKCVTWDIKDVINCIGGIQVLFPLLEQVNRQATPPELTSPDFHGVTRLNKSSESDGWVVLPSSSYADTKLEQNQVAGFLTLMRNMMQTKPVNQQTFVQTNGAAIIGALLQKVNAKLVDVNVLMAVQLLIEATASTNRTMLHHMYQYILFDFRIWSRSDFPVRIGHIQYLSTIIKDDRKHFRKLFGVQYILDVIRTHYSNNAGLSEEDARTIRISLLNLVKYFIVRDITIAELNSLLSYMMYCGDENMIIEALDILIMLLESGRKQDQLFLLMFEPKVGEMLYGLLTLKGFTIIYYEKIVKVLYILLKTDKVNEKNKTRLRLQECGYLGLIGLIQGFEVSGPTIKRFIEQVSFTDSANIYGSVLAVLQLIYTSGFDIKLEASRQLLSLLVSKNGAAKHFAKQLGWQELLTHLFILKPLDEHWEQKHNSECDITMESALNKGDNTYNTNGQYDKKGGKHDGDSGSKGSNCDNTEMSGDILQITGTVDSSSLCKQNTSESAIVDSSVQSQGANLNTNEPVCDTNNKSVHLEDSLKSEDQSTCDSRKIGPMLKAKHPDSLNLGKFDDSNSKESPKRSVTFQGESFDTPSTPLYMRDRLFEEFENESELNRSLTENEIHKCKSSSTSLEDISVLEMRAKEKASQESLHKDESSTSISQLSLSESGTDISLGALGSPMEGRRDSFASPVLRHTNNKDRMLDSLGLRGSFLMDGVDNTEELCQNLLIVLFTVMWKGVEGSDQTVWKERCQVFSWLDHLSLSNELILSGVELKRRLLEMMLHACTSDIKDAGHSSQAYMENSIQLVRLVRFFLTHGSLDSTTYSQMLLEDVVSLLDNLAVWDVQGGAGWQEMVHLGLSVIMAFAQNDKLELCANATARLHNLVQTKLISSSAEAAFLIGHLNTVIVKAIEAETDNYSFVIPVMKALIDKSYQLLNLDINLPSLPSTSMSPTFFDDFKTYCLTQEWNAFIESYVEPQKQHFCENVFADMTTEIEGFWTECHKEMNLNLHKLNRERGESKLKFENQILSAFQKQVLHEGKRFQNITTQLRNQHLSSLRQWRAAKRFFTGERGAWAERNPVELHWKLSNQENFSRMKVKLTPNYTFDPHKDASMLRDNLGVEDSNLLDAIQHLTVTKEALVSKENIGDDGIGDEDWNVISAQSTSADTLQQKEKLVLTEECELVTLVEVIQGRLEVTTTHVYFFDCSSTREEGGEDFKWGLPQLREIHFRRYNLRRSALELFLVDQTNYFLNFQKKVRNRVYSRILSLRPPNLIYFGSRSPAELLKASGLTQKWVQREISNFEYLMQLNTIAGRTYNDLSQYPVFPWILSDYTSEELDLDNPATFRDLSKPVGVLNPKNEKEVREKFDNFEDPSGIIEKFHYGTHYSNAATVMHYLIRMEPFATLHIALQSGRFDVADRQFQTIPGTWRSMYNNTNDVKELIPEFFYLPEFLVNSNEFDLGRLQFTNDKVEDVILPTWAKTPEDFIDKHRKALECEHVSRNLHNWIDLIFGYKQKGKAAEEALNVFYYVTYEGAVDLDVIGNENDRKATEGMINNFGQTPCQLLKDPHPRRLTFDEVVAKSLKTDKHLSIFCFLENLKVYFVEISSDTDPLAFVCVPRSQPRSIIQHGMLDTMLTVSSGGIIGTHGWLPYDKSISNYFTFDKDPSVTNQRTRKKFSCPFAPGLPMGVQQFVVTHDGKLLISAGHWDNSLQVFHVPKGKKLNHICRHIDIVTCLALDYCGSHLITGSRDTTCMIWQVQQQGGVCVNVSSRPLQTLYGHDNEVTAVHISSELDLAVSASKDSTVMIHTVRKGHYMRTLRPTSSAGFTLNIPMLAVDDYGHIIVYCRETLPIDTKEILTLHLYSLNGKHICERSIESPVGHIIVKGDHLITGDAQGNITFYDIYGLRELNNLPLYVPIHCLSVTNGNSHLLAGLRDGKLIIIGIKSSNEIR